MNTRLLLISGDLAWRESLMIAASTLNCETNQADADNPKKLLEIARAFRPSAAVFYPDRPGTEMTATVQSVTQLIDELRGTFPELPLVVITAVPVDRLTDLVVSRPLVDVLLDLDGDPEALVRKIAHIVTRPQALQHERQRPQYGVIEITLCEAHIECEAKVGELCESFGPLQWLRRDLVLLNEEFCFFESDDHEFRQGVNRRLLETTRRRLLWHAFEKPLELARAFCEKHVANGGTIYHRFTVSDGDLEFVPFELVGTANSGEYLRAVNPLARRLNVKQMHRNPDSPKQPRKNGTARVLFILADVQGLFFVRHHRFKGQDELPLASLSHLRDEMKQVIDLYGAENVRGVILKEGEDAFLQIAKAFESELYDIVHFAGHSVRSDTTNDVFLAVPGIEPRLIKAYNAEDFARQAAEANARLVILSSCEGASCRALSRLAAMGIPAVAGFRWKVDDEDAALFTPLLYQALRAGSQAVPIAQAFHEALCRVKGPTEGRLTWFSPVLMLQRTSWHDYTLEV